MDMHLLHTVHMSKDGMKNASWGDNEWSVENFIKVQGQSCLKQNKWVFETNKNMFLITFSSVIRTVFGKLWHWNIIIQQQHSTFARKHYFCNTCFDFQLLWIDNVMNEHLICCPCACYV